MPTSPFNPSLQEKVFNSQLPQLQAEKLRNQIRYVYDRSEFYRRKLDQAGISPEHILGLRDLAKIPFTTKDELRESQLAAPPLGLHGAVPMEDIIRIHASSGTTGRPTYVGITDSDREVWNEIVSRVMYTGGMRRESRVVFAMGLTFFVGSSAKEGIERLGATFIPIGTGASDRVISSIIDLKADVMLCTPSYSFYLAEHVRNKWGMEPKELGLKLISTGGEPGGGMPEIRRRIEEDWGCRVVEAMGNADMAPVLFGECSEQNGMHFVAPDYVICEIIDPESGQPIELSQDCEGELVYTAIDRQCVPLLRFRTRDLVRVETAPCSCGLNSFRIRCIGRTDDMLIVRGVNVFPSAIRDVISMFRPKTTGEIQILLHQPPPLVNPPLPVLVEHGNGLTEEELHRLKSELENELRTKLFFSANIELVPPGTLPRFEMKAKLVKEMFK